MFDRIDITRKMQACSHYVYYYIKQYFMNLNVQPSKSNQCKYSVVVYSLYFLNNLKNWICTVIYLEWINTNLCKFKVSVSE